MAGASGAASDDDGEEPQEEISRLMAMSRSLVMMRDPMHGESEAPEQASASPFDEITGRC